MQDEIILLWIYALPIYLIIFSVMMAISILIYWRIFEKAYVPGWNSLIPFLNTYRFLQIAGMNPNMIFLIFIPVVGAMIVAVLLIIARYKLTLMFGGSSGMAVASIFLGGIVLLILAFSKKYDYMGAD